MRGRIIILLMLHGGGIGERIFVSLFSHSMISELFLFSYALTKGVASLSLQSSHFGAERPGTKVPFIPPIFAIPTGD
jgi:hypothetical protein